MLFNWKCYDERAQYHQDDEKRYTCVVPAHNEEDAIKRAYLMYSMFAVRAVKI